MSAPARPRLFEAIEFATRAHAGQFRKGTDLPYIIHPLGVAKTLITAGCSEEVVLAGILHDTVEDTPVTIDEIHRVFGAEVARLVELATDPDRSASWEDRKRHTVELLETAPEDLILVAAADTLDNARAIREERARVGDEVWKRFRRAEESQRWYFRALVGVFHRRATRQPLLGLAADFEAEVEQLFGSAPVL